VAHLYSQVLRLVPGRHPIIGHVWTALASVNARQTLERATELISYDVQVPCFDVVVLRLAVRVATCVL
jgi:hypothetical protein